MARIRFPSNPSDGNKHSDKGKTYRYDSNKNRWKVIGAEAVSATKADELDSTISTLNSTISSLQTQVDESGSGTEAYANASMLPMTNLEAGQMAFDEENNRLFITNGSGWYKITLINTDPSITANTSSVSLGGDGNTVYIGYTTVEPEGSPVTVTVSNSGISNTSQGNIVHYAANNTVEVNNFAAEGSEWNGSITLTVSDGENVGIANVTIDVAYSAVFEFSYYSTYSGNGVSPLSWLAANNQSDFGTLSGLETTNPSATGNSLLVDFGTDELDTVEIQITGGQSGIVSTTQTSSSYRGKGSQVQASIDLDAIYAQWGHRKLHVSLGASGQGSSGSSTGYHGAGGGASAVFVWTGGNRGSGTIVPLIVAGGGGGPADTNAGADAWMPTSNYTTYQQYTHYVTNLGIGLRGIDSNSRPWSHQVASTGAGNGASWNEIGLGHGGSYAANTPKLKDQFNSSNPGSDGSSVGTYNMQVFGGGGAGAYGGGGGGGYFGGFHGDYNPWTQAWGGQGYIDTTYVTLINHSNPGGASHIKFRPAGTF